MTHGYRSEIESLHAFFVRWYTGLADRDEFETVETALAPSFQRVTPGGEVLDRNAVLSAVRETYDSYAADEFDIDIRNVEGVADETALVRYEEWQESAGETNGRISTVLFAPARPPEGEHAFEWRHLQETWLER